MVKIKTQKKIAIIFLFFFCFGIFSARAQKENKLIDSAFQNERDKNNWLPSDIQDWIISDSYLDKLTGLTHAYIQQRYKGICIYNSISIAVIKENKVIYFKPGITDHVEKKVNAVKPQITSVSAIQFALDHLGKGESYTVKQISNDTLLKKYVFDSPDLSSSPVSVQLVYRTSDQNIFLAWDVSIELKNEPHWWNIRIDALTGKFIDKNDFTRECRFGNGGAGSFLINKNKISIQSNSRLMMPAGVPEYTVFPFPLEAPSYGSRSVLIDPSDPVASPYGWQDVNGSAGAEYTITRGNNVYSYEDANSDNLPGYSPDGGVNLAFNFPFLMNVAPIINRDASLTNLFYNNNRIHDYLYHIGFDEPSGNFQQNNYGRGGVGNDFVRAEGFDGSGSNNANFSTPADGSSGRMQMFLWTGNVAQCTNLSISSGIFNGSMTVGSADFTATGNVTANVILVNDGVGTVTDGCSGIVNSITGKIALIDRGTCSFISKAQAAVAAGAIAVIIANNVAGGAPGMTGSPALTVPVLSVSLTDGDILKSALLAGPVNATINTCISQVDGSFDNGIVAHEYGHGVSNRLTGGPSQAGCLTNLEQGGEGWSDWLALMMTIEPGDHGTDARGIGTYAVAQAINGAGIRRFPYSTDMNINPQTYHSIAANTEVHAIGEIWCDVIWDMSWLLIDQYGFSDDPENINAGNNIAIRLVLEGMKLQPCGPGFLDARDAILLADALLYNNIHRCLIWQAFARRGMGYNALQGSANVAGDETEGFSMPPFCSAPTQIPVAAFTSDISTVNCGGSVHFTDQSVQPFNWSWDFGDQTFSTLQNPVHIYSSPGLYQVKLVVSNPLGSDSIEKNIQVNSTFSANVTANPTTICAGDTVHLNAIASGSANRSYLLNSIPYAPIPGTGTAVSLGDDAISTSKSIGFNFNFYGQNYTNFYICSNGFITFSTGMTAQPVYGPYLPSISMPNNLIALAWNDLNPLNAGSSINFFTTGSSPNRKLIVNYNTSHYGGTIYPFVVQAILYETSNLIEIHTSTISDATAFDPESTTTQGVENLNGTDAVVVPGRNGISFTASNDAYRFTQYIPYSYTWFPGNLNGPLQNVTPASSGPYSVKIGDGTSCKVSFNSPVITVNPCTLALQLKMFIQGFYDNGGSLKPVLYTAGISDSNNACDSIVVELHDPLSPSTIFRSDKVLLGIDGYANVVYPGSITGNSYYIVIRHRNSIETWSKNPVLFVNSTVSFDFTAP